MYNILHWVYIHEPKANVVLRDQTWVISWLPVAALKVRLYDPILSDPIVLDPIVGSYEHA
jgi:hypothetical protein